MQFIICTFHISNKYRYHCILRTMLFMQFIHVLVVPDNIHTPPKEEISPVWSGGEGGKTVSDNTKCIRTS